MKSDTSFKVFFLKQYRKNCLKNNVFPWESVFMTTAIWLLGHCTTQNAHCAMMRWRLGPPLPPHTSHIGHCFLRSTWLENEQKSRICCFKHIARIRQNRDNLQLLRTIGWWLGGIQPLPTRCTRQSLLKDNSGATPPNSSKGNPADCALPSRWAKAKAK